ncbi:hypothetical protein [Pandoraea sp. ISTKB]|uniref:hypothetical protein n=1 Tax=Pandoraea sp. ISTKB TaxID=1586708 RepID=UPI0008476E66|nr:hypothetical protein [Pandoraea sp. ISTKB]ODP35020.1 hypothetical protein A9762_11690 [Pandoraea sp. ISTKB]
MKMTVEDAALALMELGLDVTESEAQRVRNDLACIVTSNERSVHDVVKSRYASKEGRAGGPNGKTWWIVDTDKYEAVELPQHLHEIVPKLSNFDLRVLNWARNTVITNEADAPAIVYAVMRNPGDDNAYGYEARRGSALPLLSDDYSARDILADRVREDPDGTWTIAPHFLNVQNALQLSEPGDPMTEVRLLHELLKSPQRERVLEAMQGAWVDVGGWRLNETVAPSSVTDVDSMLKHPRADEFYIPSHALADRRELKEAAIQLGYDAFSYGAANESLFSRQFRPFHREQVVLLRDAPVLVAAHSTKYLEAYRQRADSSPGEHRFSRHQLVQAGSADKACEIGYRKAAQAHLQRLDRLKQAPLASHVENWLETASRDIRGAAEEQGFELDRWEEGEEERAARANPQLMRWLKYHEPLVGQPGPEGFASRVDVLRRIFDAGLTHVNYEFHTLTGFGPRQFDTTMEMGDADAVRSELDKRYLKSKTVGFKEAYNYHNWVHPQTPDTSLSLQL